jgi:hypothetical protein
LEESTLEEIPEGFISPAKEGVQSSFSWRQAQSEVSTETNLKIQGCEIFGNTPSYSVELWQENGGS